MCLSSSQNDWNGCLSKQMGSHDPLLLWFSKKQGMNNLLLGTTYPSPPFYCLIFKISSIKSRKLSYFEKKHPGNLLYLRLVKVNTIAQKQVLEFFKYPFWYHLKMYFYAAVHHYMYLINAKDWADDELTSSLHPLLTFVEVDSSIRSTS